MRKIDVRLNDTTLGIWQDDANDPTFHSKIFVGLIRLLRDRGWMVTEDHEVSERFRSLRKAHRLAHKGALRASMRISGCCIEITFWSETWKNENRHGHRYDFDKRPRFTYIDRLRLTLEERAIIGWLAARSEVTISRAMVMPSSGTITATDYVQAQYAKSWRTDKVLGRPICQYDNNRKSADGALLEHGQTAWTTDSKGRIVRGVALYNINNMWWVIAGPHGLMNMGCWEIFATQPPDLRRKRNDRRRRERIEAEIARAIAGDDFDRAATLRRVAFGAEPIYRIWSRKNGAYYRPQYCGYTTDLSSAGRYTRAEAEREVRRVPHILHAIGPDGEREDFGVAEVA